MALGLQNTVKFLNDVSDIVVEAVGLAKSGLGWSAYGKVVALVGKVGELVLEAKASLPELADLDPKEAVELGAAAYAAVAKIVAAA